VLCARRSPEVWGCAHAASVQNTSSKTMMLCPNALCFRVEAKSGMSSPSRSIMPCAGADTYACRHTLTASKAPNPNRLINSGKRNSAPPSPISPLSVPMPAPALNAAKAFCCWERVACTVPPYRDPHGRMVDRLAERREAVTQPFSAMTNRL
jgi:hypothetical protein